MRALRMVFVCLAACLSFVSAAHSAGYKATPLAPGFKFRNNNAAQLSAFQTQDIRSLSDWDLYTMLKVTNANGSVVAQFTSPNHSTYTATAFNDNGAIAGTHTTYVNFQIPTGELLQFVQWERAFVTVGGAIVDIHVALEAALGTPDSHVHSSRALDVNNAGEVVGELTMDGNHRWGFIYRNGTITNLGAIGDGSIQTAKSINNAGQVTGRGSHTLATFPYYAYLYSQGVVTELGNLSSRYQNAEGVGINDTGHIFGMSHIDAGGYSVSTGFLYRDGVMSHVSWPGGPVTQPTSINNSSLVVGRMAVSTNDSPHGFLLKDGILLDLNNVVDRTTISGTINDATSINDDDVIVVTAEGKKYLLTPIPDQLADPAVYNFEAHTQNWDSAGEPIITVSKSPARKFAGDYSLSLQVTAAGFASVRVPDPTVRPGQRVTLHVYLPSDAKIEWLQPFALEGADGNWNWHGTWIPANELQLGAWNTITVDVPADASELDSIGLEFFVTEAFAGAVYLDSINFAFPTDTAPYNFESDVQGWQSGGSSASTSQSTAQSFAGAGSLAIKLNETTYASVSVSNPAISSARQIAFNIFVPANAQIDSLQPYAQEGAAGNWAWHGNWTGSPKIVSGAWNTITVDIPEGVQQLDAIGLQISMRKPYDGTLFVDSVKPTTSD